MPFTKKSSSDLSVSTRLFQPPIERKETGPTPYSHHCRKTGVGNEQWWNNLSWTSQVSAIKSGYSFKEKGPNVLSPL